MGIETTELNKAEGISQSKLISPEEVRKILNSNNNEIKKLCSQVSILPKRDKNTGKTYFLKDDVEILKRIKELHERGRQIAENRNFQRTENSLKSTMPFVTNPIANVSQPSLTSRDVKQTFATEMKNVVQTITSTQEELVSRVSKMIDDKLDGMDEVVVELIRAKTENEKLRQKINNLTKENYRIKNRLESYRPVGFGFFVKGKEEDNALF